MNLVQYVMTDRHTLTSTESCFLSPSWGFLGLRLIWQDIDDAGQSQHIKLCELVYGLLIIQTLGEPTDCNTLKIVQSAEEKNNYMVCEYLHPSGFNSLLKVARINTNTIALLIMSKFKTFHVTQA